MANTYSQINIHCVFSVKGREIFITHNYRDALYKYMYGILSNEKAFPLAVNGWIDHVHVFFEMPVTVAVSELMRILKASSSKWINENKYVKGRFNWQEGYGAFSYSRSQRNSVIRYIMNQEKHHKKVSFREEYTELFEKFQVTYDKNFMFEFYE